MLLSNHRLLVPIVALLAALTVASIPASGPLARRTGTGRGVTFLFLLGVAGVLSVTLPFDIRYYGFLSCAVQNPFQTASVREPQNYLNAVLYFPAAFFGHLAFRRAFTVTAVLATGSASIEILQMFGERACSTTDVAFNVLGGVAGVTAAQVLVTLRGSTV
ncbi:hypothetical protein GCM10017673_51080 [Streptosporangium violaceochromogenes]|nr:hypothetical protein GCM10017673_51080 [Streptosporangium violaceochromogenes]